MSEMEIDECQLKFAAESYFEGESLISVKRYGEKRIIELRSLPIVN